MLQRTRRLAPAIAVLAISALATAAEPTTEQLKAQIDALSKKVDALEARQVSSADVDATVQRVLHDAQQRSQLMSAEGFTAGYNKGRFTIQSADGSFSFSPIAQLQIRYDGAYRSGVPGKPDDTTSYDDGFEIRRAKFGFAGNMVSQDLTYKITWATDRGTGNPALEEAWVRYRFAPEFAVFGGQFQDFSSHETSVATSRQMAVEESAMGTMLNPASFPQGVGLAYETAKLRVQGAYHDGINSQNTKFFDTGDAAGNNLAHWGAVGRVEWMAVGDNWREYDDFTAQGDKSDLLVFGAGIDVTQFAGKDAYFYGADVQWEPLSIPGLGVYGGYVGQYVNQADLLGVSQPTIANNGFIVQASYMLSDKWEVFGRYDLAMFDNSQFAANDVQNYVHEITTGVNYYLYGHAAKFTADIVYLPNGADSRIPATSNLTGAGILPTDGGAYEVVGRVQFQLLL